MPSRSPHAVGALAGDGRPYAQVAAIDVLADEAGRAIGHDDIHAAGMIAARGMDTTGAISVFIGIHDAGRRIRRQHGIERHDLGLAIGPDLTRLALDSRVGDILAIGPDSREATARVIDDAGDISTAVADMASSPLALRVSRTPAADGPLAEGDGVAGAVGDCGNWNGARYVKMPR